MYPVVVSRIPVPQRSCACGCVAVVARGVSELCAGQGSGFVAFADLVPLSPAVLWQMLFPPCRKESRLWLWSLADGSMTREVSGARRGIAQPSQGCCSHDPAVQQQPVSQCSRSDAAKFPLTGMRSRPCPGCGAKCAHLRRAQKRPGKREHFWAIRSESVTRTCRGTVA